MPRPPRFDNPVRVLRKALGLSQAEFAKELRVSDSYVQAIELGQRPINDDLAEEISFRFGFTPESLKQVQGTPTSFLGEHLPLEEAIATWKGRLEELEAQAAALAPETLRYHHLLLEKARLHGKAGLFNFLFSRWLLSVTERLNLQDAAPERKEAPLSSWTHPSEIIRDGFMSRFGKPSFTYLLIRDPKGESPAPERKD